MNRTSRAVIAAAAVVLLIVVGWTVAQRLAPDGSPTPPAVPRSADAFPLTVDHVFDGDTIAATAHTPNDLVPGSAPIRIRLIGIDAPEGTPEPECGADAARARLAALLPEGSTVWAALDQEPYDRYERLLAYLWTDDGEFVNLALVAEGDAVALRVEPDTTHHALFDAAESAARTAGLGQWSAC